MSLLQRQPLGSERSTTETGEKERQRPIELALRCHRAGGRRSRLTHDRPDKTHAHKLCGTGGRVRDDPSIKLLLRRSAQELERVRPVIARPTVTLAIKSLPHQRLAARPQRRRLALVQHQPREHPRTKCAPPRNELWDGSDRRRQCEGPHRPAAASSGDTGSQSAQYSASVALSPGCAVVGSSCSIAQRVVAAPCPTVLRYCLRSSSCSSGMPASYEPSCASAL